MRLLGRILQRVGLVALPAGIALQLVEAISLAQLLIAMVAGAAAVWIGRIVEGYAGR